MTETEEELVDNHRAEFAIAYLARADASGSAIRSVLFAISLAALGYVLANDRTPGPEQVVSASLFLLAMAGLYLSWEFQKAKARDRFKILRKQGARAYLDSEPDRMPNRWIDRPAAGLVFLGIVVEAGFRLCQP